MGRGMSLRHSKVTRDLVFNVSLILVWRSPQINADEQRCPKGFPSVTRGLEGFLLRATAPRTDDLLALPTTSKF